MPAGTCDICGCTEMRACPPTCHWRDEARRLCSQCVGWLRPAGDGPFRGIVPYELWPVRTLAPVPLHQGGRVQLVWPVDVRRLDADTLERLAFAIAPTVGRTAVDWLEAEGAGLRPFLLAHAEGQALMEARSVEKALALLDEYKTTGRLAAGGITRRAILTVAPEPQPGGAHRG